MDIPLKRSLNTMHDKGELLMFAIDSEPFGLPYREWTGRWWQWALSTPKSVNPLEDRTGKYCAEGQGGPVWFLAGTTGNTHSSKRKCIVPYSKAILFPIIVSQFSFLKCPLSRRMNN